MELHKKVNFLLLDSVQYTNLFSFIMQTRVENENTVNYAL